jgi:hypothetical protein
MFKISLVCIVFCGSCLMAQEPLIPSQVGTTPLTNEAVQSNIFDYGTTLSGSFDDNVTNPKNPAVGETNFTSSIQPRARLSVDRSRWTSSLYYGPGFTYSSNISAYNNTSHAAGAEFKYNFTRRLWFVTRNSFSMTSGPYESFQANAALPSLGLLSQPNSSAIGANVHSRAGQSQGDLVYLIGPHTSVGIGGTFTDLRYETIGDSALVNNFSQNSRGWSGHAFYSHQLTMRYSFGVQYTAHNSTSTSAPGKFSSLSHQVLGSWNVALTPSVQLSFFAGPEISEIDDNLVGITGPLVTHSTRSSVAGGSTLSWRGEHNGMSLGFVQQVNDPGISGGGAVSMRTVNFDVQRRITKLSTLYLTGNYTSNSQLDPLSVAPLVDSASAGLTFSKVITPHLSLQLSGIRQQFMGNSPFGFGQRSHDIASVSLSYTFQAPIGR